MASSFAREHGSLESCRPGQFGAQTTNAGATFHARSNLTLIDLRGNPANAAFLASAQAALGAALPLRPNTTAAGSACNILWLGPDEWLLAGRDRSGLSERLAINDGYLTDVSHGRAAWRITGPRTLDVLVKGCSIDLHMRAFAPGNCAQTSLAHVSVLLHRLDLTTFEIYCARSYAQHLWRWFAESDSEFGYEILAPAD